MAKIYSQLKHLSRKEKKVSTPKPHQTTVEFLLSYSKALSVNKLNNGTFTEMILN